MYIFSTLSKVGKVYSYMCAGVCTCVCVCICTYILRLIKVQCRQADPKICAKVAKKKFYNHVSALV